MLKEHQRVVLKTSLPAKGPEAGDVGTVVQVTPSLDQYFSSHPAPADRIANLGRIWGAKR